MYGELNRFPAWETVEGEGSEGVLLLMSHGGLSVYTYIFLRRGLESRFLRLFLHQG